MTRHLIPQSDERHLRAQWQGSGFQMLLDNDLCDMVDERRTKLETAKPEEVPALQAEIRLLRSLYGRSHKDDKKLTQPNR